MKHWLDILKTLGTTLAPIIVMLVPGGAAFAPLVPIIIDAIGEAEQIKGATGPEKKQHVLTIVGKAVEATNTVAKKAVLDPALTLAASSAAIDTVVSTINLVQAAQVAVPVGADLMP